MEKKKFLSLFYWFCVLIAQFYIISYKGLNDGFYWNILVLISSIIFILSRLNVLKKDLKTYQETLIIIMCINLFVSSISNIILGSSLLSQLWYILFIIVSITLFFLREKNN